MRLQRPVDAVDQRRAGERVAGECAFRQQVVRERRARGVAPGAGDREAGEGGLGALGGVHEARRPRDRARGARRRSPVRAPWRCRGSGSSRRSPPRRGRRRSDAARPMTSTSRLPCTPISTSESRCRAVRRSMSTSSIFGAVPDQHGHFAVPVPAERGDAAGQLVVVFPAENRVDDEGLEPGVPQAAGLGGAGVDVRRGEGDLARVQQDGLAQRVAAALDPVFDDLHRHLDELQGLRAGSPSAAVRAGRRRRRRRRSTGWMPGRRTSG